MAELRPLYGGAITCAIPQRFFDISQVREVPDHQEVFTDADTDESIIIEMLANAPGSNLEEVAKSHWESIVRLNQAQASATIGQIHVANLQETLPNFSVPMDQEVPGCVLLMGHFAASKFNETAKNQIDVYMLVLRLEKQQTDILLVLNSPTEVNPASSSAKSFTGTDAAGALALFQQVVASFRIEDWKLFP